MADTEFEEFRHFFERLPQHIKAPSQIYSLVHDIVLDEDSPTSSKSGTDDDASGSPTRGDPEEEEESGDPGGRGVGGRPWRDSNLDPPQHRPERRRRKLPEIPKNKKSLVLATAMSQQLVSSVMSNQPPSLADELGEALNRGEALQFAIGGHARPLLVLKCAHGYIRDEDSSPDSERFQSSEVDSGHSTAHSPDGPKSTSPPLLLHPFSPASTVSSGGGGVPFNQLEMLEATHRGLHKFVPRHHDEIEVEIGDPIYVQKEADDLWCEGVNLRSGRQGIIPSAYVVDMDYSDFDPATPKVKRERYLLGYLGSVETKWHKGTSVLCQAVRKMVAGGDPPKKPHSCILEVSDQGLRMVDKRPRANKDTPCLDYFYSLKNVSFCAFHPRDHRYMGFITKHPQLQRFACHVFLGQESTRPVAEAIGRAFQRFYTKYIETAFPTEDIYIE